MKKFSKMIKFCSDMEYKYSSYLEEKEERKLDNFQKLEKYFGWFPKKIESKLQEVEKLSDDDLFNLGPERILSMISLYKGDLSELNSYIRANIGRDYTPLHFSKAIVKADKLLKILHNAYRLFNIR